MPLGPDPGIYFTQDKAMGVMASTTVRIPRTLRICNLADMNDFIHKPLSNNVLPNFIPQLTPSSLLFVKAFFEIYRKM